MARERAAVHPPEEPGFIEFAKVAANRVRGNVKLGGEIRRQDTAVGAEAVEDQRPAFVGQHLRETTRSCLFVHKRA